MYLPWKASKRRIQEAERARSARGEIVKALSSGQITRRELVKWGLFTAGGALALKRGLSPFAPSAYADGSIPTGTPRSPLFGAQAFTQALPRLELLTPFPVHRTGTGTAASDTPGLLTPDASQQSNQTQITTPLTAPSTGPAEGRPAGEFWGHQRWDEFFPALAYDIHVRPASNVRFHPSLPVQQASKVWAFNGTFPPKLIKARYGQPILVRQHNDLPFDAADNGGFGRNETSIHLHNGHTPAESDGFTGAFFFPGQYYDYRYPNALAGYDTYPAGDPKAGFVGDDGGVLPIPGDWREAESTLWFHDHRFNFTSQNVYKGLAGMLNLYGPIDRGNEVVADGANLRLPSGSSAPWGNTDFDVNLMFSDKAFDQSGQLFFDIFDTDGFLGDVMTVNGAFKPYLEVQPRQYRFRLLNADVARFLTFALSDGSPFFLIANDGNLLTQAVQLTQTDQLGVAERYDLVVNFARYKNGDKVWLVNLAEHENGKLPARNLSIAQALSGQSSDPGVGKVLEFRVVGDAVTDPSRPVADKTVLMGQLPDRTKVQVARTRDFVFGDGGSDRDPWTINDLTADYGRISALPKPKTAEIWRLHNDGGDWDHPVHIHFEECQTLARSGGLPITESLGRKDVWRLHPDGSVTVFLQFREFTGMYVEHCHNTTHEDHAMLLRWELDNGPTPLPTPIPKPTGVTFVPPKVVSGS